MMVAAHDSARGASATAMEPVLAVAGMWALFIATHIGLATAPVRGALVGRLGEFGFLVVFGLVAAIAFTGLVMVYAAVADAGPPGPALAAVPLARVLLIGA